MAKPDLVAPAAAHNSLSDGVGNMAQEKAVKSDFRHVSEGNWTYTLKAIEAFLVSKGEHRQGYGADLIMFLERCFSGKYRNGENYHYQQIMPSAAWRKGDSLSEKLTRCKDKETFKRRFDRIGTTAILKREHFDNREITNLDFKGRMYLRLIDTKRDNLSLFYRNDPVVDAFIKSAIAFYRDELRAAKYKTRRALQGKPEVVAVRKPEVVFLENPNPLLYTEVDSRRPSGKNKGNSLKLVHSSPAGKDKSQPRKEVEGEEISDFGFSKMSDAEFCGLVSVSKERAAVPHNAAQKSSAGLEVFRVWRDSVLGEHPDKCISESPTKKLVEQAADFYMRFSEFFPAGSVSHFFTYLSKNWVTACKDFKDEGIWQKLGSYPVVPTLLTHSNHVLTWYKNNAKGITNDSGHAKKASSPAYTEKKAAKVPEVIPLSPYKGCVRTTAKGRTFHEKYKRSSLEYEVVAARGMDKCLPQDGKIPALEPFFRIKLQEFSIDMASSEARIEELSKLTLEEFDLYCC